MPCASSLCRAPWIGQAELQREIVQLLLQRVCFFRDLSETDLVGLSSIMEVSSVARCGPNSCPRSSYLLDLLALLNYFPYLPTQVRHLETGTVVFREGQKGDSFYVLIDGEVSRVKVK